MCVDLVLSVGTASGALAEKHEKSWLVPGVSLHRMAANCIVESLDDCKILGGDHIKVTSSVFCDESCGTGR